MTSTDGPSVRPASVPAHTAPGAVAVDWQAARAIGRRLCPPGPRVGPGEAAAVVEQLRQVARQAREPVANTAQLRTDPDRDTETLVVDRPGWLEANVASMAALMAPVVAKLGRLRPGAPTAPVDPVGSAVSAVGAKATGAEAGALLAYLSGKVLGQYDLAPQGTPRLLLVAPNILAVQRELGVSLPDFMSWVAMHEETHRVQFTAVPWLREFLLRESTELAVDLAPTPQEFSQRLTHVARNLPEAVRGGGNGLVEVFATPEQRAAIARLTAVMALLEGHADVVMDEVGPAVIPTVATIRDRFTQRRQGVGGLDRLIRRVLGLEGKMRQYRDGARFVRAVQGQVGVAGFNAVWTCPEHLPTPEEIAEPGRWVARVHG